MQKSFNNWERLYGLRQRGAEAAMPPWIFIHGIGTDIVDYRGLIVLFFRPFFAIFRFFFRCPLPEEA